MRDETEIKTEYMKQKLRSEIERMKEINDQKIYSQIDQIILQESKEEYITLDQRQEIRKNLFNAVRGLDLLQELIDDDEITEIMVNGTEAIFIEKAGEMKKWKYHFTSKNHLEDLIQQIAGRCKDVYKRQPFKFMGRIGDNLRFKERIIWLQREWKKTLIYDCQ